MEAVLEAAHFQLTRHCNLHCRFCGQAKGVAGGNGSGDLPLAFWLDVAAQLKAMSPSPSPTVTLWGGEPLMYPFFDDLANYLKKKDFRLGLITNGTLIDRHLEAVSLMDDIHISVDGREDLNDAVRGVGTFAKIKQNLELLRPFKGHLYCLVTVSDQNVDELAEIPNQLAELRPDAVTMGQLIYLNGKEIENFRRYSRKHFGCDCPELEGWRRDDDHDYLERLSRGVAELNRRSYCVPASFTPHTRQRACCRQPWKRIHVRYDGEVGFCTDFFSFSAGNLREKRLVEIFHGERAELFREAVKSGCLSICAHCPWRLQ
ncbi:MAG: radical SAM protein [Victivallales bacterium]|nr:radical SAM protein [Victivallales bacterium]